MRWLSSILSRRLSSATVAAFVRIVSMVFSIVLRSDSASRIVMHLLTLGSLPLHQGALTALPR